MPCVKGAAFCAALGKQIQAEAQENCDSTFFAVVLMEILQFDHLHLLIPSDLWGHLRQLVRSARSSQPCERKHSWLRAVESHHQPSLTKFKALVCVLPFEQMLVLVPFEAFNQFFQSKVSLTTGKAQINKKQKARNAKMRPKTN